LRFQPTPDQANYRAKREGGFSCEKPPSLSDFLKIWYGFQTTTLFIPQSFESHEPKPAFS